jgi:hypothetical protein
VTAAVGCFLGVSLAESADATALQKAYGEFQVEAQQVNPNYQPQSVNTDGWKPTQQAWKTLFPSITIVLCFLHTVLGVQQLCRRTWTVFKVVTDKLWHLYDSPNRRQFARAYAPLAGVDSTL